MEDNPISMYETVIDRYGKKHKVYSVRFKDVRTVTKFTEKYSPDAFGMYILSPVLDEDGNPEVDRDGNINYNNGFYDDLLEVIELALDERESREQIETWLDVNTAREIVMVFLGLSQFKKKVMSSLTPNGEISLPQ